MTAEEAAGFLGECPRCGSIMCDGCYPAPVEYPGHDLPLPEEDS